MLAHDYRTLGMTYEQVNLIWYEFDAKNPFARNTLRI